MNGPKAKNPITYYENVKKIQKTVWYLIKWLKVCSHCFKTPKNHSKYQNFLLQDKFNKTSLPTKPSMTKSINKKVWSFWSNHCRGRSRKWHILSWCGSCLSRTSHHLGLAFHTLECNFFHLKEFCNYLNQNPFRSSTCGNSCANWFDFFSLLAARDLRAILVQIIINMFSKNGILSAYLNWKIFGPLALTVVARSAGVTPQSQTCKKILYYHAKLKVFELHSGEKLAKNIIKTIINFILFSILTRTNCTWWLSNDKWFLLRFIAIETTQSSQLICIVMSRFNN